MKKVSSEEDKQFPDTLVKIVCTCVCVCVCVCERDKDRDTEAETDIQIKRERETDRQGEREKERERMANRTPRDRTNRFIGLIGSHWGFMCRCSNSSCSIGS